MKAYVLYRKLVAQNGTCILHPLGIAADEKVVKEMAEEAKGFVDQLATAKIVVQTPDGPRAAMSVAQLFAEMGISEVGYCTMAGEAKETTLVVPRKLVHLQ